VMTTREHLWDPNTNRCWACQCSRESVMTGDVAMQCRGGEPDVQPAADFHDTRCPYCAVGQDHPPGSACAGINAVRESASPADIRAKANGPWPEKSLIERVVEEAAAEEAAGRAQAPIRMALPPGFVRTTGGSKLTPEEIAELRQAGKAPVRLNTVAEAIEHVRTTGKPLDDAVLARTWLTREQLAELYPPIDEESKRLRDMVDRLRLSTGMAELDAENARLRRELRGWKQAAHAAQRMRDQAIAALPKAEADNVIRIEPFPDPEPRSDSWPPPSHKPRMLP